MSTWEFVVDSREPKKAIAIAQTNYPNTVVEELHSGDFACRMNKQFLAGIERKALEDFAQAMKSKVDENGIRHPPRLASQVERLRVDYPVSFIILEGHMSDVYAKCARFHLEFHEAPFWGMVTSISVRDNIHFLGTETLAKTVDVAYRICETTPEGKYQVPRRWLPKRASTPTDMMELIPGVTRELSTKLLNKYGSIRGVSSQSLRELKTNHAVGPALAKRLKRYLCSNDFNSV